MVLCEFALVASHHGIDVCHAMVDVQELQKRQYLVTGGTTRENGPRGGLLCSVQK